MREGRSGRYRQFPSEGWSAGFHKAVRFSWRLIAEILPRVAVGKRDGRGRHRYDWAPFSAGFHKCSGYPLAMLEIPVVIALMFLEYDMELLDDLPGMDYKQAFGVVGPTDKPVRVRYKRRARQ